MDSSRFGKLSPELRNRIFGHVLIFEDYILVELRPEEADLGGYLKEQWQHVGDAHALMATCTQINAECGPVSYGANTFKFTIKGAAKYLSSRYAEKFRERVRTEGLLLRGWLHCLGDHARFLRSVHLGLADWGVSWTSEKDHTIENATDVLRCMYNAIRHTGTTVLAEIYVTWSEGDDGSKDVDELLVPLTTWRAAKRTVRNAIRQARLRAVTTEDTVIRKLWDDDINMCSNVLDELLLALQRKQLLAPVEVLGSV